MPSLRRPSVAVVAAAAAMIVSATLAAATAPVLTPAASAASPTPTPAASGGTAADAPTPTKGSKQTSKESWSATPAQLPNSQALRTSFFIEGQPGSTIFDALQVANFTGARLPLQVYASDAGNIPEGGVYTVRPVTDKMTDVGTWVTPQKRSVKVPKGKGLKIPFKVTIPKSAAPGDHIGGIVTIGSTPKNDTGGSKVLVQRAIATRLYVRVGGFNTNAVVVEKVNLKATAALLPGGIGSEGKATVTYTYRNVGTLTVRPKATITMTGLFGRTLHKTDPIELPETYPGQAVTLSEAFEGMPAFDRVDAQVDIVDEGTPKLSIAGATGSGNDVRWVFSWLLVLIVLLLVSAIVAWFIRADRRRSRRAGPEPQLVGAMGVPAPFGPSGAGAAMPPAADSGGASSPGRRRAKPSGRGRRGSE